MGEGTASPGSRRLRSPSRDYPVALERVVPDPLDRIRTSYSGGAAAASDRTSGGPLAATQHDSDISRGGATRQPPPTSFSQASISLP